MNNELTTTPIEMPAETAVRNTPLAEMSVQQRISSNDQLVAALAPVIKKNHVLMQGGKSYVCVAGGIAIANALGFTIGTGTVTFHEETDGKFYSAEATLIDKGVEIGRATGYLGMDEDRWSSAPLYARRSMCSTRAVARLLRQNFGHFYVALGHSDTPSEELPSGGFSVDPVTSSTGGMGNMTSTGASKKYDKATTPAPKGEESYHVTAVDEWSKDGATWTKYTITLAEGFKVVTFEASLATQAEVALSTGDPVMCNFTGPNQYGSYDLKSMGNVAKVADAPQPTKEVEVPF